VSSNAAVQTPFDELAESYSDQWSQNSNGRAQREQVWLQIDSLFKAGDRILDLGCGIGDDALHFAARGIEVMGVDSSERMTEIARSRGVNVRHMPIESIPELLADGGIFDGAISNFGALNCIAAIRPVALDCAGLIRPGGVLAICVIGRFSCRETVRYLSTGDVKRATRRWSGHAEWRGLSIYYRAHREMVDAFAPHFQVIKRVSIGGGDHQLYIFRRGTV
jgi:2-polyprenyl-3-methyl-5-hydroxy-6-metoxy-1,4-benzoquinol methylase